MVNATVTDRPPATPEPLGDGTTAADRVRSRWYRWRWPLAIGGVVLLAAVIVALTTPTGGGARLDPAHPGRGGTRAVAEVLRQQGVDVQRVVTVDRAVAVAGQDSTLVVVNPDLLSEPQLKRLDAIGTDLVLVRPDRTVLKQLAPEILPSQTTASGPAQPGCDLAAARKAGRIRSGGRLYQLQPGSRGTVCFPGRGPVTRGTYLVTDRRGHRVQVIGQEEILVNEHLSEHGNAALSLYVLGARKRLVWLVPDPMAQGAGTRVSLWSLLPAVVLWSAFPLLLAMLSAMGWRVRRLGRLVPEPLPVVVRAVETHEGRARLYQRARARERAAATLRTATLRRVAARLALPPETSPEQVVELAASHSGTEETLLRTTLLGPPPTDDAALVRLADELDALEKALHRPTASDPAATREVHP